MYETIKSDTVKNAKKVIAGAVAAASITGAASVPFADTPLLITEQVAMMAAIVKIYKLDFKEDALEALAVAAIAVGGATLVGRLFVSGVLKIIPGASRFIAGAVSAATAGALTYAMGKATIDLCDEIRLGRMEEDGLETDEGRICFTGAFKTALNKWKRNKYGLNIRVYDWDEDEDEDTNIRAYYWDEYEDEDTDGDED